MASAASLRAFSLAAFVLAASGKLGDLSDTAGEVEAVQQEPTGPPIGSRFTVEISNNSQLFSNVSARISGQEGSCAADAVHGSVFVGPQGSEHHTGGRKDTWDWTPTMNCSSEGAGDRCTYSSGYGFSYCPASGSGFLHCDCNQCPCGQGRGGFACSSCTENSACPAGQLCSMSSVVTRIQAKAYSCTFSHKSSAYKVFWSDGWAHPQGLFHWDPQGDTLTLDLLQNMCSHKQPILMQCRCHRCNVMQDTVDPISKEVTGTCTDRNLPSPCARCDSCRCSYPEDSYLSPMVRGLIGGVDKGLTFGCADVAGGGKCTGILDNFKIPLQFDCSTGLCTDNPEDGTLIQGSLSAWTTLVSGVLVWLGTASSAVIIYSLAVRTRQRRLAAHASPLPLARASTMDHGLTLQWEGVRCVRGGAVVLDSATGSVHAPAGSGRLVAVIGPSGCGKTTLLDFLSGRGVGADQGRIHLNGKHMRTQSLRRYVGYVPQQEVLGATLTVREALDFSAALRLRGLSAVQRCGRVSWAIARLQLEAVADSRIGDDGVRGISGGERRRVAIAAELLAAPAIMVLDEPTTGLDAASALSLGHLLAGLAEEGRLLLCSLHQPRPELMAVFHECIEVTRQPMVTNAGNPVSHDVEAPTAEDQSPKPTAPGSCEIPAPTLLGHGKQSADAVKLVSADKGTAAQQETACCRPGAELPARISMVPWPCQLLVLWRRSTIEGSRGSRKGVWSAVVALGVGLFCGLVFKGLDDGITGVQNRFGSVFFVQLFFAFCGLEVCSLWHADRPRAAHERAANFYSGSAYFVAKATAYLWWYCLVLPAIFVAVSYALIGYSHGGLAKPLFYFLCVCGTAAASSGICLLTASLTSSLSAGVSTSAITLTVLLVFSGFLRPKNALPAWLRWLVDVSPFSHAFAAMIANELQGVTTHFNAKGYMPVDIAGDIWLYQFHIDPADTAGHSRLLAIIAAASWLAAGVLVLAQWYDRPPMLPLPGGPSSGNKKGVAKDGLAAPPAGEVLGCSPDGRRSSASGPSLSWKDLSFKLPSGQVVLDGLSGGAAPGRPLAILGPSGCGKTSMLGRLAGESPPDSLCRAPEVLGTVLVDGAEQSHRQLGRIVGYVRQDIAMHGSLSVCEVLSFAAALRLPHLPARERAERVASVLRRLQLEGVTHSRIGDERRRGVSGGERRRVAVGLGLLAACDILVLDEPTSGLDAAGALSICRLLSELAMEGRVVIATVHQPKPEMLTFFQDLLILAPGGHVAYYGPPGNLGDYLLATCGPPPAGSIASPADRVLDSLSCGDRALVQAFAGSEAERSLLQRAQIDAPSSQAHAGLVVPKMPPVGVQMRQLLVREVRMSLRERGLALWHFSSAIAAGLLLGCSFRLMQLNLVGVISRIGLFFCVQCILGMQALQGLMAWHDGHTIFVRERASGFYSTGAYVVAKALVDALLLRVGPPLLLGALLYPLAGLHDGREVVCLAGFCLASLASSTFCLFLGALAPRSAVTLPIAVLVLLVFLLLGGIMLADPPVWLASSSFFRASYHMLVSNEFLGLTFQFDPAGIDKSFDPLPGAEWLRLLHFSDAPPLEHICVLLLWSASFVILAWVALARTCR